MNSQLIKLDWDTKYFGVHSAKLTLNNQLNKNEFTAMILKLDEFDFTTIVNINNNSVNNNKIGRLSNAFLVDVNVQFEKMVRKKEVNQKYNIQNNYKYDNELIEIANNEFTYSRFYNDPNLNEKLSKEIYLNWVKNSFEKDNKYFIVAQERSTKLGFILFSISNQNEILIELISLAANSQGLGIGTKIIESLEVYAFKNKMNKIVVGTQIDNIQAVNFYMKKGFNFISKHSIYHYWPKMESAKID